MKHTHAIAYLRQICCSGMSSAVTIPEFLRALHQVIPSGRNFYSSFDAQFNMTHQLVDVFIPEMERLAEVAKVVIPAFFTPTIKAQYAAWFSQHPSITGNDYASLLYRSDFYHLLFRPLDQHHVLEARVLYQASVVGAVTLTRPQSAKPFNAQEQAMCVSLTPYIAHALKATEEVMMDYLDSGASAMMVMNTQGNLLYLSDTAKQLLLQCQFAQINLQLNPHEDPVMAHLAQLCRDLQAIFEDKAAPPPSWSYTNAQGRFQFRAYWLTANTPGPGGLIGILIEHQEPQQLKILRALQHTSLSPTQKEVAVLLTQGFSNEQIGERLHVKPSTVKDHLRKIFTKLDIHQREELLPKLLTLEQSAHQ